MSRSLNFSSQMKSCWEQSQVCFPHRSQTKQLHAHFDFALNDVYSFRNPTKRFKHALIGFFPRLAWACGRRERGEHFRTHRHWDNNVPTNAVLSLSHLSQRHFVKDDGKPMQKSHAPIPVQACTTIMRRDVVGCVGIKRD